MQKPEARWESNGIALSYEDSTERMTEVEHFIDVTFYPEGSGSGGILIFSWDDRHTRIVIDPFTGRISSEETKCADRCQICGGFTLLEVIIALAITGFVLGGLFSLVGGKQLTWRSQESLTGPPRSESAINFAFLQNEFAEVEEILEQDAYRVRPGEALEAPGAQDPADCAPVAGLRDC